MDGIGKKRVAIYARVSTEEQAEHGYSIDAQKEALTQYCNLLNKEIVGEYVDAGISGKEMSKRLELQRLLHDAELGKFDEVLVWKFNRMSRNTKDLLEIVDKLKKNSVDFTSLSEKFDTSGPMGRFALQMLAAVGELERNTIVENVKLGLKQRARMGLHNGSRALGYNIVPQATNGRTGKNDLVIVENEAVIVRNIFNWFCEGQGFKAIANKLNHDGYKTVKGKPFSICAIREIVDNPLYKGYVRYGKYEDWSEKRRKGKNANPIVVKGKHPAIVSETLWNKAAGIRGIRSETPAKVHNSNNILCSILRCPECDAPMVIGRSNTKLKNGTKRIYRYYCCSNFKNKGSSVCHSNSVPADKAEAYVLEQLIRFLGNPTLIQQVLDSIREKTEKNLQHHKDELAGIDSKLDEIGQRKSKLMDLYIDGCFDKEMLDKRMNELNTTADQLTRLRNSIKAEGTVAVGDINADFVQKVLVNFKDVMDHSTIEQKHLLLKLLIDKITVKNKSVDKIYLKLGGELEEYINGVCPPINNKIGGLFLCSEDWTKNSLFEVVIEI